LAELVPADDVALGAEAADEMCWLDDRERVADHEGGHGNADRQRKSAAQCRRAGTAGGEQDCGQHRDQHDPVQVLGGRRDTDEGAGEDVVPRRAAPEDSGGADQGRRSPPPCRGRC